VTSNIAEVKGSAEQTGRAADAVLDASMAMSEQTETLKEQVAQFLATVRAA
jgi:methyl-accepting chemotaxis protein